MQYTYARFFIYFLLCGGTGYLTDFQFLIFPKYAIRNACIECVSSFLGFPEFRVLQ